MSGQRHFFHIHRRILLANLGTFLLIENFNANCYVPGVNAYSPGQWLLFRA